MKKILALSSLAIMWAQPYHAQAAGTYMMIDVGSSSSKVYLCDETTLDCDGVVKSKPGIHNYKTTSPSKLNDMTAWDAATAQYIYDLIHNAIIQYEKKGQSFDDLRGLYAYATAGMRSVIEMSDHPEKFKQAIDDALTQQFTQQLHKINQERLAEGKQALRIPVVFKTMTGSEETAYAWLAFNVEKQPSAYQDLNEMGGFSMQYAHFVSEPAHESPNLIKLTYKNNPYYIESHSYFVGVDKSWKEVVKDNLKHPCVISQAPNGHASGKLELCKQEVEKYIERHEIKSVYAAENTIILTGGGYMYPLKNLRLNRDSISVRDFKHVLEKTALSVCSMSKADYIENYIAGFSPEIADKYFIRYHQAYCFDLVHYKMIFDKLNLPDAKRLDLSFSHHTHWLHGKLMSQIDADKLKS